MSKATNVKKADASIAPAKAAKIKENNSTERPKKEAKIQEDQAEKAQSKSPAGIDFTDPDQRKKDQEEARAQNEKDAVIPEGVKIK